MCRSYYVMDEATHATDRLDGGMAAKRAPILLCFFRLIVRRFSPSRAGAIPAEGSHGRW